MEPITRKEKFLAKAGGQNIELPNPVTREEMFLAAIGGTNGGRGWVEHREVTVECKVDAEENVLEGFPLFAVGDTVTVKVDGVAYSLVAFDDRVPVVGDSNEALGSGNLKYGWAIACLPDDGVVLFATLEDHVVSYDVEVIHKIDKKFLPDDIGGGAGTMIMTTPSLDVLDNNISFRELYYDDGTRTVYDTAERLVNFLNEGGRCLLFCNGVRKGEIFACHTTETSDGYTLVVCGFGTGNSYVDGLKEFSCWLT